MVCDDCNRNSVVLREQDHMLYEVLDGISHGILHLSADSLSFAAKLEKEKLSRFWAEQPIPDSPYLRFQEIAVALRHLEHPEDIPIAECCKPTIAALVHSALTTTLHCLNLKPDFGQELYVLDCHGLEGRVETTDLRLRMLSYIEVLGSLYIAHNFLTPQSDSPFGLKTRTTHTPLRATVAGNPQRVQFRAPGVELAQDVHTKRLENWNPGLYRAHLFVEDKGGRIEYLREGEENVITVEHGHL